MIGRWPLRPRGHARIALAIALALSVVVHLGPLLDLVLCSHAVMAELAPEAAIPVEVVAPAPLPAVSTALEPPPTNPQSKVTKDRSEPTAYPRRPNGDFLRASILEAGAIFDGAASAGVDGSSKPVPDAAAVSVGPLASEASFDAGATAVEVNINADLIREHPVAHAIGALLERLPEWQDLAGEAATELLRSVDWVVVTGPSLLDTGRDSVVLHYAAPDTLANDAIRILARDDGRAGHFDAGTPAVRGTAVLVGGLERVVLQPGGNLLVLIPKKDAYGLARTLAGARLAPHLKPNEALYARLVGLKQTLPDLADSIAELRLRIVLDEDGTAHLFAEGETADADAARSAAAAVVRLMRVRGSAVVALASYNLVDRVEVKTEGRFVKAHLVVTQDQLIAVVAVVGGVLGDPSGTGTL